jgi:hypothetical protein
MKSKILYLMVFLILPLGLSAQDGWSFEKVFPKNRMATTITQQKQTTVLQLIPMVKYG